VWSIHQGQLVCRPATYGSDPSQSTSTRHVRLRRAHAGAEQSIIRFSEPSANFPTHVHLDQRELLHIPRVDLVEVGG
jgi:hypothetical protein